MADIDRLEVQVEAQATKANNALDRLITKLDRISINLGKVNSSGMIGFANGIDKLARASASLSNIKTSDFTRLTTNIQRLSSLNTQQIYGAASAMTTISKAMNRLGSVSANSMQVAQVAKDIAKLGGANVQKAITNLPLLATELRKLMQTLSTAPVVSQNVIRMTNSLANLASQGSKVGTASRHLNSSLNGYSASATRAHKSSRSLAAAFGRMYANYFLFMRAIKGLWSSIKSTADYIEAFNYFDVSFGKIASEWSKDFAKYGYDSADAYAKSFTGRMNETLGKLSGVQLDTENGVLTESGMKNLGLNIKEITQYASQLASITNSVGLTGESSLAASSSFTRLAGDISSLFNIDYSAASKNLQSGLIGQSRALYKYGIDITNATLQTYAYKLGLSKAVSEMTQGEKMQLRMIAILDQSKVAWGDLANTIDSPSNMIRQFKNNLKETGMVLGQLFIPLLQKVLPVVNGVTIAIKRLVTNIAGVLGVKLDLSSFGQGYTDLEDGLDDVADSFDDATSSANKFKASVLGFDELNKLTDQSDSGKGLSGIGGSIDLTDEILKATDEYDKIWNAAYDKMENRAQEFADKIEQIFRDAANKGDFSGIGNSISSKLENVLAGINWDSVYSKAKNFGTGFATFLNGLITPDLFGEVGKTIAGVLNSAIYNSLSFSDNMDWKKIGESIANGINNFFDTFDFGALAETLNTWVDGIEGSIASALNNIEWGEVLKDATEFLKRLDFDTVIALSLIGKPLFLRNGLFFGASKMGKWIKDAFLAKFAGTTFISTLSKFSATTAELALPISALLAISIASIAFIDDIDEAILRALGKAVGGTDEEIEKNIDIAKQSPKNGKIYDGNGNVVREYETGAETLKRWFNNIFNKKPTVEVDIETDKKQAQTDVNKTITEVNKSGNTKPLGTSVTADTKKDANSIHAGVSAAFSALPKLKTGVLSTTPVDEIWRPYSNYFSTNNLKTGVKTTTPFSSLYTQYSEPFAKNPLKTGVSLTKSGTQLRNETQSGFGAKNLSVGITTTSANSVFSQFESSWNKISSNKILSVGANLVVNSVKTVAGMTMALKADGGIFANGTWRPVAAYAGGGTPTSGQMFVARENGPELVGTIGGHTAVMNNNQIVSSVAAGVADAVANVIMAFSGQQRTEEPTVEVTVRADSETLYRTVQKGKQKADRRYHVVAEF